MAEMPDRSVDFVLTDPPFGSRYRDRSGRTVANDDSTLWLKPAFAHIARVLKNNSFCVSFYGWHKVDAFMAAWRGAGLRPRAHFVWPKCYASSEKIVAYCHEQAYLLCKGEPPKPELVLRDVLEWRYSGNIHHPTQKPLVALRPLIAAYSAPGDIVLDPFAGSGATAVAAKQASRRYIAIELSSRYCEAARERLRRLGPSTGKFACSLQGSQHDCRAGTGANQLAKMQHPPVADQLRACGYFHDAEVIEKIVSAWCTMNGLPVPTL